MPQEPMIWVRKPDGTKVRLTLAEFRASKKKSSVPPRQASSSSVSDSRNTPESEESPEWDKDDHTSLMEVDVEKSLPMVQEVQQPQMEKTSKQEERFRSRPVPQELSRLIESARERPILQDIRPSLNGSASPARMRRTMGPVDELGNMTLVELRRLGGSVSQIGEVISKKFHTLKADTFLQYVAGVKAWEHSPVYMMYVHVLEEALKNKETIVEYTTRTAGENSLTAPEVALIQQIHAEIRL